MILKYFTSKSLFFKDLEGIAPKSLISKDPVKGGGTLRRAFIETRDRFRCLFALASFPLRILGSSSVFVGFGEREVRGGEARQASSGDFQVHDGGLKVAGF